MNTIDDFIDLACKGHVLGSTMAVIGLESIMIHPDQIKFYKAFIKKSLKVHDFKPSLFNSLSYLVPSQSQDITSSTIDLEQIYLVAFNNQQVKREMREF